VATKSIIPKRSRAHNTRHRHMPVCPGNSSTGVLINP